VIEIFSSVPAAWWSAAALLGLLVGSFLNVVIYRLPRMMEAAWAQQCAELRGEEDAAQAVFSLSKPASHCPTCQAAIPWYRNVPLLSYLLQGGRCASCREPIAWRYPLVELVSSFLAAAVAWKFGFSMHGVMLLCLVWSLIALTFIDLDTYLLPDSITLPLLWAGLLVNLLGGPVDLESAVMGAVVGYGALWSVYHVFRLATGKEGMGYGDFKLLAALGAWMGWQVLPLVIIASSLVGALVGIALIVFAGHERSKPIPFGPYLAMGGLIALFWGDALSRLYLLP